MATPEIPRSCCTSACARARLHKTQGTKPQYHTPQGLSRQHSRAPNEPTCTSLNASRPHARHASHALDGSAAACAVRHTPSAVPQAGPCSRLNARVHSEPHIESDTRTVCSRAHGHTCATRPGSVLGVRRCSLATRTCAACHHSPKSRCAIAPPLANFNVRAAATQPPHPSDGDPNPRRHGHRHQARTRTHTHTNTHAHANTRTRARRQPREACRPNRLGAAATIAVQDIAVPADASPRVPSFRGVITCTEPQHASRCDLPCRPPAAQHAPELRDLAPSRALSRPLAPSRVLSRALASSRALSRALAPHQTRP